jgi:hypothetical protein
MNEQVYDHAPNDSYLKAYTDLGFTLDQAVWCVLNDIDSGQLSCDPSYREWLNSLGDNNDRV